MLKYKLLLSMPLIVIAPLCAMDVAKQGMTEDQKKVAGVMVSSYLYGRDLSEQILKNKGMQEIGVNIPFSMGIKKQQLTLGLLDELKNKKVLLVTEKKYNEIVEIHKTIRNAIEGRCLVPASRFTKIKRFGVNFLTDLVPGVVLGTVFGGFVRSWLNNKDSVKNFETTKEIVFKDVFHKTAVEQYPKVFEEVAYDTITNNGCLHDQLIEFTKNTVVGENPGKIGMVFGEKMRNAVLRGPWPINPWGIFHNASVDTCFEINNSEIELITQKVVEHQATDIASKAIENLVQPSLEIFSPHQSDAFLGGGAGVIMSFLKMAFRGGVSHPIADTEIKNMNQKI